MRPNQASIGELVQESLDHVRELFRKEILLAKAELKQEAAKTSTVAVLAGAALLFASLGTLFFLWAVAAALAPVIGAVLAPMAVGAGALLLALILGLAARSKLSQIKLKPERAARQLERTVEWAKNH